MLRKFLALQPEERRQRLDGIEEIVAELTRLLEVELFNEVFECLSANDTSPDRVAAGNSKQGSRLLQ